MKLSYSIARILGRIAEIDSAAIGVQMVISIVDESGNQIFFGCMDQALPVSRELAISKAYTAAVIRMDTRTVGELSAPGAPLYGIQNTHDGKIILFGGGMPLKSEDQVAGAVGISGGTVEEDEEIALSVQTVFTEILKTADSICRLLPEGGLSPEALESFQNNIRIALEGPDGSQIGKHAALIITGAMLLAGLPCDEK